MILAIDPSLSNTAIVRGDARGYEVETFSSENCGDNVCRRVRRYAGLMVRINQWIGDLRPDAIFIEGYSFDSTGRGRFSAEYGGLLRWRLAQLSTSVWEISPLTLKKFASGRGRGNKGPVIAKLRARYGVEFKTSDEYDAFALYQLGLMVLGFVEPKDRAQSEVLYQLRNPQPRKPKPRRSGPRRPKEKNLF